MAGIVSIIVCKLLLQGCHLQLTRPWIAFAEYRTIDRTAGSRGTHQVSAPVRLIEDVPITVFFDPLYLVDRHVGARALQQPFIELVAADGMSYGCEFIRQTGKMNLDLLARPVGRPAAAVLPGS